LSLLATDGFAGDINMILDFSSYVTVATTPGTVFRTIIYPARLNSRNVKLLSTTGASSTNIVSQRDAILSSEDLAARLF